MRKQCFCVFHFSVLFYNVDSKNCWVRVPMCRYCLLLHLFVFFFVLCHALFSFIFFCFYLLEFNRRFNATHFFFTSFRPSKPSITLCVLLDTGEKGKKVSIVSQQIHNDDCFHLIQYIFDLSRFVYK